MGAAFEIKMWNIQQSAGFPGSKWGERFFKVEFEFIFLLKIEPCGFGSIIQDMEAESYKLISFIGEHLDYFLFLLVSRTGTVGWRCRDMLSIIIDHNLFWLQ